MLRTLALSASVAMATGTALHNDDAALRSDMITMRDGTQLYTSIRDADPSDPKPVILQRTTYGGNASAKPGFVSVHQHQRGTTNSEGRFQTWRMDHEDTVDTMEWLDQQPWFNGDVYTEGSSALGLPQYAAVSQPGLEKWVRAQAPTIAACDGRSVIYPGGAFYKALVQRWMLLFIRDSQDVIQELKEEEYPGAFWDPLTLEGKEDNAKFPALHHGGWYDIFSKGQVMGFDAYQFRGGPGARGESFLLMDPCGHCATDCATGMYQGSSGRNPMPAASRLHGSIRDYLFGVTDVDSLPEGLKPLTFFVMGPDARTEPNGHGNYYTTLDDWPTPDWQDWYLHSDGSLNQTLADGTASTSYAYDPNDPTPTLGGNNLTIQCGAMDQTPKEARDDVLVFSSGVLQEDTAMVGSATARLFVSSSAVDTDFAVILSDVTPSGESILVQDGIQRMKWRNEGAANEYAEPELLIPDQVYEVQVEVWPTAYVFAAGHEIRVSVASANEPRFDANSNTGRDIVDSPEPVVARNTVYHSARHPSSLQLPVVSLDQLPEYILE